MRFKLYLESITSTSIPVSQSGAKVDIPIGQDATYVNPYLDNNEDGFLDMNPDQYKDVVGHKLKDILDKNIKKKKKLKEDVDTSSIGDAEVDIPIGKDISSVNPFIKKNKKKKNAKSSS